MSRRWLARVAPQEGQRPGARYFVPLKPSPAEPTLGCLPDYARKFLTKSEATQVAVAEGFDFIEAVRTW